MVFPLSCGLLDLWRSRKRRLNCVVQAWTVEGPYSVWNTKYFLSRSLGAMAYRHPPVRSPRAATGTASDLLVYHIYL